MAEKVQQVPKHTYGPTYARQRKETQFDILDFAIELKQRVARYIMNEKRVPKRWRYVEGLPALNYAREIRDCVSDANDIRIDTGEPGNLRERKRLQYKAISACNKLQQQLADISEECEGATDESMRVIVDLITVIVRRIPKWIKSDSDRMGKS